VSKQARQLVGLLKEFVRLEEQISKNSYGHGPAGRRRTSEWRAEWKRESPETYHLCDLARVAINKAESAS
jgi:hypothetical protein